MQFIDLKAQHARIAESIDQRIAAVLTHGQYIMGPEVVEFEEALAAFTGSKHCIGVANGTDALQIALMALGVGPGDEVITPAFSFISAAEVIVLLGAKPVFVDIDPATYICTSKQIEAVITERTKAIIPVDLFGLCADYDAINAVAEAHNITVIEDAAQSMGATYKGRRACSLSRIATTSFFPSKPLGGYGDGGACFTDDDNLADIMRSIRVHGQAERYHHPRIGVNGRLDTLQAAILLTKLEIFDEEIKLRSRAATTYRQLFDVQSGRNLPIVQPPQLKDYSSVYAQYTLRVPNRSEVIKRVNAAGVPTAVHYPVSLNRQSAFEGSNVKVEGFPESERAAAEVLSIPMHPYLDEATQSAVVDAVTAAVEEVIAS